MREEQKNWRKKRMTFETDKNIGGIGAILLFIGLIPYGEPFLGIIALIGFIMVLIALHGLADYYKEQRIFNNALYGFITTIAGGVAAIGTAIYIAFYTTIFTNFLYKIYPSWNGKYSSLAGMTPTLTGITSSDVAPIIGAVFGILAITWIFLIIATFFDRRSLKTLGTKANVGLFSTAGLLLLIGAILTIVFIGFLLMWIAILLMIIAFFQLKPQAEATPSQPPPPQPQAV